MLLRSWDLPGRPVNSSERTARMMPGVLSRIARRVTRRRGLVERRELLEAGGGVLITDVLRRVLNSGIGAARQPQERARLRRLPGSDVVVAIPSLAALSVK